MHQPPGTVFFSALPETAKKLTPKDTPRCSSSQTAKKLGMGEREARQVAAEFQILKR